MITGSALNTEKSERYTGIIICSCVRCVISLTFIASGMLKGVNIDAFSQTVGAFLGLWGISADCSYVIAACICIGEMALGYVALIRMLFIRFHWAYPMVMSVFAYITYTNLTDTYGGIESCGCFGEFIHLNPAHSFYKNLALLLACVGLSLHTALISPRQELCSAVSMRKLSLIIAASALPIVFSMIFMHIIGQSTYILLYVVICVISFTIEMSERKYYTQRLTTKSLVIGLSVIFVSYSIQIEYLIHEIGGAFTIT